MPLNICIQWNVGPACVSECVLKTLACRGLRVGPSKDGARSLITREMEAGAEEESEHKQRAASKKRHGSLQQQRVSSFSRNNTEPGQAEMTSRSHQKQRQENRQQRLSHKKFVHACTAMFENSGQIRFRRARFRTPGLREFFGPHQVLGRELSEFRSSYYLCVTANSSSFLQNSVSLPQNSVSSLL